MMPLSLQTFPIARALASTTLFLYAVACNAQTMETAGGGLRISGFGTLGGVHADVPTGWGFRRDASQPNHSVGTRTDIDSRLGLQLNYTHSARFELVGQLLAARRSSSAKDSDALEWGFASYRPNADLAVRAGRLNVDQFLMSDYRNVGFAYLFVRPPVEFYSLLPTSLDGADITQSWSHADAQWRAKVFVGRTTQGDIDIKPLLGIMVSRETEGLLLRVGLTRTKLATSPAALQPLLDGLSGLSALPVADVPAQAGALRTRLDLAGSHITYAALGISYERHDWQWAAELARTAGHPSAHFVAGYLGIGRRIGPVTVFGLASRIDSPEPTVDTPSWGATLAPVLGAATAQQAQILGASAAYAANIGSANQRTLSLGARWDVHARIAVKFQWDHVRIGTNSGLLWANPTLDPGRADIGSVALDFVF